MRYEISNWLDDNIPAVSTVFTAIFYRLPWRIKEARYAIKYAYQRVVRGYDDLARWNYWSWNAEMSVKILTDMIENGHGFPSDLTADGSVEDGMERWTAKLTEMRDGFQAILDQDDLLWSKNDGEFQRQYAELQEKFESGMHLVTQHYRSLWD